MKEEVILGQLITDVRRRDAIHIAMCPVIAGQVLEPGEEIGILKKDSDKIVVVSKYYPTKMLNESIKMLGIVDPFLKGVIPVNASFWMLLFPNTITNLRHEWEHPHFR